MLGAGPDTALDNGVSIAAEPVKQAQTQSKATAKSRTRIFILFEQAPVLISPQNGRPSDAEKSVNREKIIGKNLHRIR